MAIQTWARAMPWRVFHRTNTTGLGHTKERNSEIFKGDIGVIGFGTILEVVSI